MRDELITLQAAGRRIEFTMRLDPNDDQDKYLLDHFMQGMCYEPDLAWLMFRALKEGDFAIDVGANVGFFSLLMSRLVGPSGTVFAFEPGSNNLPKLTANLKINSVTNVRVIEQPLWSRCEDVTFYLNSDSGGGNALFDPANWPSNVKSQANPRPIKMRATTLDALATTKERVRLIKIDTEGAEQRVLEGAAGLLQKYHPPYILAELNPHGMAQAGCTNDSFRNFMRSYGYEMFFVHPDDRLPSLVPHKTQVDHIDGVRIMNVLFSDLERVGQAWEKANG